MTEAKPLKVAIIGTAPTSKMLAPYQDESWNIWACSAGNMNQLPRVNIWFELHALNEMMAPENRGMAEPFFMWLKEQSDAGKFQVVMQDAGTVLGGKSNTFVPKAIPYPRDEMIQEFGRNWFTSSVAYMMALAIARGATEIALFGVDMAADQEHYSAQRAGCTRFIEIARERGIKVSIPFESCLNASTPMYGYSEGTPFGRRLNAVLIQVQAGYNQAVANMNSARDQMNYFGGAMEQLRYFQRTWTDGAELENELGKLEQANAAMMAGMAAEDPFKGPVDMPLRGLVPEGGTDEWREIKGTQRAVVESVSAADHSHDSGELPPVPHKIDGFASLVPPDKPNGHMTAPRSMHHLEA